MSFQGTEWIWRNGEWIRWEDATIHVLSHVVHYGSSVFEGIRCYATPQGPAIFRLPEHMRRFRDSAKIYRMEMPDMETLEEACKEVVVRNEMDACYIRPIAFRGYGSPGVDPAPNPVDVYFICWEWGAYLGPEALARGVDACISTWLRPFPDTYPAIAKAGGNYLNGQLMKMEAHVNGYAEAIALGPNGMVSEGSGQNVFLVRDGVLITPSVDGTFLQGITRDSIIGFARDLGITVREQNVPREMLYVVLGREEKYKAKSFLDTVVYRGGDAVSAWAYAGLRALGLGLGAIALVTVPVAAGWAWLAFRLGRRHGRVLSEAPNRYQKHKQPENH